MIGKAPPSVLANLAITRLDISFSGSPLNPPCSIDWAAWTDTPGLRDLQGEVALENLLGKLKDEQSRLSDNHGYYTPLAVKISPDIDQIDIDRIAESLARYELDAVIATNTTVTRPGVSVQAAQSMEQGGLSGEPLNEVSSRVIARLASTLGGTLPIIGVGGIMNASDAWEKFTAGATLIQL